jgi:hypothetical protein
MRFMAMHRSSANDEAGIPPSPQLIEGIGKLIEEGFRAGVFLGGEGLKASGNRVRLHFSGGRRTITRGPFGGSGQLLSGFALIQVRTMDEAIEWGSRLAAALDRDVEIEIGPVCEPWDLGMGPKPPGDLPIRFLILHKGDQASEAGLPASPGVTTALAALKTQMTDEGVLLMMESLQSSARSARLKFNEGRRTMIDGPFAESKELIAGFSLLKFDTLAEVVDWTDRFGQLFPAVELDIRPLHEPGLVG